jgi:hypothetical protein
MQLRITGRILGFAQLELASVPEKTSVVNSCFCDDGLALQMKTTSQKLSVLSKKIVREGFFRIS